MPLTDEQRATIDGLPDANGGGLGFDYNLRRAAEGNPDQAANNRRIAETHQVPVPTVVRNQQEFEVLDRLRNIDVDGRPKTRQFLENPDNAEIAIDDIPNLTAIEDAAQQQSLLTRMKLNAHGRFNELAGNLMQMGIKGAREGVKALTDGQVPPGLSFLLEEGETFAEELSEDREDYQPYYTFDRLMDQPSLETYYGMLLEQGPASLVDMAAASNLVTLVPYIASLTQEVAEERAVNSGRDRNDITTEDYAYAGPVGLAVAALDRVGAAMALGLKAPFKGAPAALMSKKMTGYMDEVGAAFKGTGMKPALMRVGAAGATEAATEAVQEGIQYVGETAGTDTPMTLADAGYRMLGGAVMGASLGAVVRGAREAPAAFRAVGREAEKRALSMIDQEKLDEMIELAGTSQLSKREQSSFKLFLQSAVEHDVYIDREAVEQAIDDGLTLPDVVAERIREEDDTVAIPMDRFLTEVATDEAFLAAVRPHTRTLLEGRTLAELEDTRGYVQKIMDKVITDEAARDIVDAMEEDIERQLTEVGALDPQNARLVAPLVPQWARHAAMRYADKGVRLQDIQERMNLEILGPLSEGFAASRDAQLIGDQSPFDGFEFEDQQDFGDTKLAPQDVVIKGTGRRGVIARPANRAWAQGQKRRDVATRLKECLNA